MSHREIVQGLQVVGIDERPIFTLDVSNWGTVPSSISLDCYKWVTDIWVDVEALCFPAGSPAATGNVITLPVFVPQAIGDNYRIEVKFTVSGSILEAYALVDVER